MATSPEDILQGRFIGKVLTEASKDIAKAQDDKMSERGFSDPVWDERKFIVSDSVLSYQHKPQHRFVDMKTRNTKSGKKRKKSHPIHNRIIFGHYNEIVGQLQFGYTDAVKQSIKDEIEKEKNL